jgi:thymidylate synthase (FAD)
VASSKQKSLRNQQSSPAPLETETPVPSIRSQAQETVVNLIWITPDAEKIIEYIARVSNPNARPDDYSGYLLKYLIDHNHWSPFEMASACLEIYTTRDIGRQILRHRSFSFQEFSQRYSATSKLLPPKLREARTQDLKNRQNSFVSNSEELKNLWAELQRSVYENSRDAYSKALEAGIAKEQARALLPEGLTPTRLYMSGTIRSWMHYCKLRTGDDTQKEHRTVAELAWGVLKGHLPTLHTIL